MTTSSAINLTKDGLRIAHRVVVAAGGVTEATLLGKQDVFDVRPSPFTHRCGAPINPEAECQVQVESFGERMWINVQSRDLVLV